MTKTFSSPIVAFSGQIIAYTSSVGSDADGGSQKSTFSNQIVAYSGQIAIH